MAGECRHQRDAQQAGVVQKCGEEPAQAKLGPRFPLGTPLPDHQEVHAIGHPLLQLLDAPALQPVARIPDQHATAASGHEQQHKGPIKIQQGGGLQPGEVVGTHPHRTGIEAQGFKLQAQLGELQGPQPLFHIGQVAAHQIGREPQLAGGRQIEDAGQGLVEAFLGASCELPTAKAAGVESLPVEAQAFRIQQLGLVELQRSLLGPESQGTARIHRTHGFRWLAQGLDQALVANVERPHGQPIHPRGQGGPGLGVQLLARPNPCRSRPGATQEQAPTGGVGLTSQDQVPAPCQVVDQLAWIAEMAATCLHQAEQ